jgi:hypothetical protein
MMDIQIQAVPRFSGKWVIQASNAKVAAGVQQALLCLSGQCGIDGKPKRHEVRDTLEYDIFFPHFRTDKTKVAVVSGPDWTALRNEWNAQLDKAGVPRSRWNFISGWNKGITNQFKKLPLFSRFADGFLGDAKVIRLTPEEAALPKGKVIDKLVQVIKDDLLKENNGLWTVVFGEESHLADRISTDGSIARIQAEIVTKGVENFKQQFTIGRMREKLDEVLENDLWTRFIQGNIRKISQMMESPPLKVNETFKNRLAYTASKMVQLAVDKVSDPENTHTKEQEDAILLGLGVPKTQLDNPDLRDYIWPIEDPQVAYGLIDNAIKDNYFRIFDGNAALMFLAVADTMKLAAEKAE